MKKIGELQKTLSKWTDDVQRNLIIAQKNTAKKIWEDVIDSAPIRDGNYVSSIQVGDTTVEKNRISTTIFTDLLVGGSDPKWSNVPLGALLEWGTGIKGANSNTYPHGYSYRLTPWCYYDKYLNMYVTTTGMVARPHFHPSLLKNKKLYLEEIGKAVKQK